MKLVTNVRVACAKNIDYDQELARCERGLTTEMVKAIHPCF